MTKLSGWITKSFPEHDAGMIVSAEEWAGAVQALMNIIKREGNHLDQAIWEIARLEDELRRAQHQASPASSTSDEPARNPAART